MSNFRLWPVPSGRLLIAILLALGAIVAPTTANAHRGDTSKTRSSVQAFASPDVETGTSTLSRSDRGVVARVRTSEIAPRHALTLWWVVFNLPDRCTPPACGDDDLFVDGDPNQGINWDQVEAADIVVAFADGAVSRRNGKALLRGALAVGGPVREIVFGDGPALKDARVAEVHLVVRSHGPVVRSALADQLSSFGGGCEEFLNPPSVPSQVGQCADIQFSVHEPRGT